MHNSIRITGLFSTVSITLLTLLFIIAVIVFPAGIYTSAEEYVAGFKITSLLPVIPSFLLVLANVPLFVALYFYADTQRKIYGFTGIIFGTGYMVCSGINYFTQLGIITRNMAETEMISVAPFLMANPGSFSYALDNLGYTFLSFAFLAFSWIFNRRGLQSWIKTLCIVFGISGLLGSIGYILNYSLLENMVLISAIPYLVCIILLYYEFRSIRPLK